MKKKWDISNILFLTLSPLIAILGVIIHLYYEGWQITPWLLAFLFYLLTGLSITAGYHRLFAHRSYQAHWSVRFIFLMFGAASFQNSLLKWATDHRIHHQKVDSESDPYTIKKGFFYAHIGWIFYRDHFKLENAPKDLRNDPMIMFQHNYYIPLAIFFGLIIPLIIGYQMGSALGGFFIAGWLRIVAVHHSTFFINSLCHTLGNQPYEINNSARDSWLMALLTFGEGYHNFHHKFQFDYRNGIKWYHFDPTKWLVKLLSYVKLTSQLKSIPAREILASKRKLLEQVFSQSEAQESLKRKFEEFKNNLIEAEENYLCLMKQKNQKMQEIQLKIKLAQKRYQLSFRLYKHLVQEALTLRSTGSIPSR